MPVMTSATSYSLSTKASASRSRIAGRVGGLPGEKSSTGSTRPVPRKCAHRRFAKARAKYGFSRDVTHSASLRRGSPSKSAGTLPSGNLAVTRSPDSATSIFGARPGAASWKNAASSQNCSCVHGSNGWSWHCAHSIRTPRNARDVAAARFSGLSPFAS